MLSASSIELIRALLRDTGADPTGVKEVRFRANHPDLQNEIDTLIRRGRIRRKDGRFWLHPLAIAEVVDGDTLAGETHRRAREIFNAVYQRTRTSPETIILVEELANELKMFRSDLVDVLNYLCDSGIFGTYSGNLREADAYVTPSVTEILRCKTYDGLIEQSRVSLEFNDMLPALPSVDGTIFSSSAAQPKAPYVDAQRLKELRSIQGGKWDLTRLVRLCEELNSAHESELWMACAMLARGILDHIPPIFGCANFGAIANNLPAAQSFRQHMQHLDRSLRQVANSHLHVQIRGKESLPTFTQVDFRADLDALLAEIGRLLR
ncbi:MAG: hypothetical protein ABI885_20830 [Gammaproteobacteria bacterium]